MKKGNYSFGKYIGICILSLISVSCGQFIHKESNSGFTPGLNEIMVAMPDGIQLATDIYLPKKKTRLPVVLVRTPYNKSAEGWMGKAFNFFGIAVVIQDVRGKHKSEGEFYPFINERSDGLQTLKWIREQPWSDGTITGWGASYLGFTQWAVSDSLDFLTLLLTSANMYDFLYPGGHFSLQSAFVWGFQNASADLNKIKPEQLIESLKILPLSVADDSTIKDIAFINDWLANSSYNEYWEKMNFRGNTKAPIISLAGWYDIFLEAQIKDFQSLLSSGNPDNRLIIGPWCHGSMGEPNEYGGLKKTGKPTKIFKFVKRHIKGQKKRLNSPLHDSKYNLFIMERNEYVGSDVWPPKESSSLPFYLGPEGYLSNTAYPEKGLLEYEYDPLDPYISRGGTALGDKVGPSRQNENIQREDQLVFEMEITGSPLVLLGPISSTLWVETDALCTDFVVGIQDVFPDGKIINIQEGIARIEPDDEEIQKLDISVWSTGYQLNPGHSLRVVISSSWFPRFNRSLNNCDPIFSANEIKVARQKVFYGADTPSALYLPVYSIPKR